MAKQEPGVGTADALRIAGIDPLLWQNALARGYTSPPPGGRGAPRVFTTDDIAALFVFDLLLERLVPPGTAAQLAAAFREALRTSQAPGTLSVVKVSGADGRPRAVVVETPPDGSKELWRFNVVKLRRRARRALIAQWDRDE